MSEEEGSGSSAGPAKPRRRDPVITYMSLGVFVVAATSLTLVAFLLYSAMSDRDVPRTKLERDLIVLEQKVAAEPQNAKAWSDYIKRLLHAEKHDEAREAVTKASEAVGDENPLVLAVHARLLLSEERFDQALEAADEAVRAAEREKAESLEEQAAAGIVSREDYEDLIKALLAKAEVLEAMDRWDEAVSVYDAALSEKPSMADVSAAKGDAAVEAGDHETAREAYESALQYVPDYEPALRGMERIKAVSQ